MCIYCTPHVSVVFHRARRALQFDLERSLIGVNGDFLYYSWSLEKKTTLCYLESKVRTELHSANERLREQRIDTDLSFSQLIHNSFHTRGCSSVPYSGPPPTLHTWIHFLSLVDLHFIICSFMHGVFTLQLPGIAGELFRFVVNRFCDFTSYPVSVFPSTPFQK